MAGPKRSGGPDGVVIPASNLLSAKSVGERKRGIYNAKTKEDQRRELRKSLTRAEVILWKRLQGSQLDGKKFRRQASIGPYIVDFYCPESRLIVELDGTQHYEEEAVEYDRRRTEYLS